MRIIPCLIAALLVGCGNGGDEQTNQVQAPPGSSAGSGGSSAGSGGSSAGVAGSGGSSAGGSSAGGSSAGGAAGSAAGGSSGAAGVAGQNAAGAAGAAGVGGSAAGSAGVGGGVGGGSGLGGAAGVGGVGADVVCDFLVQTGAPVEVAVGMSKTPVNPALTHLGGGKMVLAFGAVQNEFPAPGPPAIPAPDLRFATIDALGAWPTAPIPILPMEWLQEGNSYTFEAPASESGAFQVLSTRGIVGDSLLGPVEFRRFDLLTGTLGDPVQVSAEPSFSLFFSRGDASLVGLSRDLLLPQSHHRLEVSRLVPGQPAQPLLAGSGCATAPLVADAVWQEDHFLIATSSSRDAFSCDDDNGIDTEPTRIQLFTQGSQPQDAKLTFDMDQKAQVRYLRLLPSKQGAWLVSGVGDGFNLPLRMIPIMKEGFPGAALLDLTGDAVIPTRSKATSMSDGRVAAAYIDEGGQVPHTRLRAVSLDGVAVTEVNAGFATDLALGSPAPDTIVISWVDGGGPNARLMVARYRCEQGE